MDDRPINAKGTYTYDIEFEDDYAEKQVAKEDSSLMDKVMAGVQNFLLKKVTKKNISLEESKGDSLTSSIE